MPPAPRRRRWVREAQIDGHHGQLQRVHKPKRAQPSAASTGRARWTRGGNTRIARCGFEALRRAALFFFCQEQGLGIEQALGTLGKTHEKGRSDRTHASRDVGTTGACLAVSARIRAIVRSWPHVGITQALGNIGKRHERGRSHHTGNTPIHRTRRARRGHEKLRQDSTAAHGHERPRRHNLDTLKVGSAQGMAGFFPFVHLSSSLALRRVRIASLWRDPCGL